MENEFPPNSHQSRDDRSRPQALAPSEKQEVRRVTRSKATLRKKPLHKRFLEAFKPEDNKGFVEYTLLEIFVPSIQDAFVDAGVGAIENLFGRNQSHRPRSRGRYTSYNRMSEARPRGRNGRDRDDDRRGGRSRERRAADDAKEILVETRVEADEVLDNMFEILSRYEVVTMRDLLSLVGEQYNPTHEDWGWYDLRGARIHKVRGAYLLDLPRPEPLD